ncbi:hypothetical protein CEUSTIGMA_g2451.t1 [Chlamydomonas eustigma]|uniref:Uncharacterized protein n=1 Tax=Chlamydomonas eustigma TaxID=1157962 RepID=A0A250WW40_9CHLO|nr:hypothetical protein CEUSTIGMA_g2451.t1 [Chlamydomonas eustigma]|eukprot:GAX75005.1 hypothetical protein CEUSTIGMA_g2451.t1 [Chlamydomonas eustigma]
MASFGIINRRLAIPALIFEAAQYTFTEAMNNRNGAMVNAPMVALMRLLVASLFSIITDRWMRHAFIQYRSGLKQYHQHGTLSEAAPAGLHGTHHENTANEQDVSFTQQNVQRGVVTGSPAVQSLSEAPSSELGAPLQPARAVSISQYQLSQPTEQVNLPVERHYRSRLQRLRIIMKVPMVHLEDEKQQQQIRSIREEVECRHPTWQCTGLTLRPGCIILELNLRRENVPKPKVVVYGGISQGGISARPSSMSSIESDKELQVEELNALDWLQLLKPEQFLVLKSQAGGVISVMVGNETRYFSYNELGAASWQELPRTVFPAHNTDSDHQPFYMMTVSPRCVHHASAVALTLSVTWEMLACLKRTFVTMPKSNDGEVNFAHDTVAALGVHDSELQLEAVAVNGKTLSIRAKADGDDSSFHSYLLIAISDCLLHISPSPITAPLNISDCCGPPDCSRPGDMDGSLQGCFFNQDGVYAPAVKGADANEFPSAALVKLSDVEIQTQGLDHGLVHMNLWLGITLLATNTVLVLGPGNEEVAAELADVDFSNAGDVLADIADVLEGVQLITNKLRAGEHSSSCSQLLVEVAEDVASWASKVGCGALQSLMHHCIEKLNSGINEINLRECL